MILKSLKSYGSDLIKAERSHNMAVGLVQHGKLTKEVSAQMHNSG